MSKEYHIHQLIQLDNGMGMAIGPCYKTGEEYSNPDPETLNHETIQNALGHSVLIIGYIKKGTVEDKSTGKNTDWLIVRDNQVSTDRNVIVPFVEGTDTTGWNNILATIYVRP